MVQQIGRVAVNRYRTSALQSLGGTATAKHADGFESRFECSFNVETRIADNNCLVRRRVI